MILALLVACTDREPPDPPDGTTTFSQSETAAPPSTGDTATVAATGETGAAPIVCDSPYATPLSFTSSSQIQTEEDFDFDANGHLLSQYGSDLLGISRKGGLEVLAANVGQDIAGIRSLPTGDVIVAQQDTASVRLVSLATGGSITVVNGLDFPNGLEVEEVVGSMAYVSEYSEDGRVRMFDPYTGESEVVLRIANPNGLALSPDEQTLYVAVSEQLFWGSGRVVAIDRDASGEWDDGTLRVVYEANTLLDALAVDVCGNLYVTTYRTGRVIRVWTDGTVEELIDLPNVNIEGYCAARFGPGIGDWSRTTLYVSNRYEMYAIDVGIEGRHVLAP